MSKEIQTINFLDENEIISNKLKKINTNQKTRNMIDKSQEQIAAEQQQAQQQQLIQSLGPAALGSKLLDPKNNAQAQQLTEELDANQEAAQKKG